MLTHNLEGADRDTLVGPIVVVPLCTMLLRRTQDPGSIGLGTMAPLELGHMRS